MYKNDLSKRASINNNKIRLKNTCIYLVLLGGIIAMTCTFPDNYNLNLIYSIPVKTKSSEE